MRRRDNLGHLILTIVVTLDLTLLTVDVDAQGRIAFESDRDWDVLRFEIYVMDADGGDQRNVTNNPGDDRPPHGLLTVNGLPLVLIGMIGVETGKST